MVEYVTTNLQMQICYKPKALMYIRRYVLWHYLYDAWRWLYLFCKVISFDWQDDTGNALWICTNISSKVQGYDRCWAYRRYLSRSFLNVFASAIWFFGFLLTFVQLRAFMSICLCFSSFPSGVTCGTKDPHAPFYILCWSWKVFFVLYTDISIN